ncbi:hypothetical protein PRZ48_001235 [Zasmidium cellare]|uniref:Alpha/beta hydrolase fold-3 domain-containing protein n=1 Tax=Zasmidium cellare TaxID=395010 RepID=A0ABR0F1E4_ZASCE|nr:hypothetical protein PRZ48_001235 [Zasmidium cellare]
MSKPEPIDGAAIDARFSPFNIINVNYKHVKSVGIPLSILLPKTLKPGKHPITVRWHGGGFGTGHRLFPEWYAEWTLQLSLDHEAIAISPDYRLLPEASGLDILSDAEDFYTWLFDPQGLASLLPEDIVLDLENVLVTGESAGGWHALQAALLHPSKIRAIIAHYPMIDLAAPHFSSQHEKDIFSPPRPQADSSILTSYVENLTGEEVVPNRTPPEGEMNVLIILQQGLYPKYFGPDPRLYPLEQLEKAETFPPTWILHGTGDSVVPVEGTRVFEEAFRERGEREGWGPLKVTYREGAEHGFDLREGDEDGWRREGVQFIEKYWPAKR